jgi:hypothetical protein
MIAMLFGCGMQGILVRSTSYMINNNIKNRYTQPKARSWILLQSIFDYEMHFFRFFRWEDET